MLSAIKRGDPGDGDFIGLRGEYEKSEPDSQGVEPCLPRRLAVGRALPLALSKLCVASPMMLLPRGCAGDAGRLMDNTCASIELNWASTSHGMRSPGTA